MAPPTLPKGNNEGRIVRPLLAALCKVKDGVHRVLPEVNSFSFLKPGNK